MKKLLSLLLVFGMFFSVAGCSSEDESSETSSEETVEETKKDVYEIGETAEADGIKITVNSTRVAEGFTAPEEGKQYFVLDISLENTTDETFSSSTMICYEIKDGEGRTCDLSIVVEDLNGSLDTEVDAGEKAAGEIAFEVPVEGELTLKFTPLFDESVKIKVR